MKRAMPRHRLALRRDLEAERPVHDSRLVRPRGEEGASIEVKLVKPHERKRSSDEIANAYTVTFDPAANQPNGQQTYRYANAQVDFPARFQLVAAMNPCPCGYRGDPQGQCRCSGDRVSNYLAKISGPLLDRIDLKVEVERPPAAAFRGKPRGESTATVRRRVADARARAERRQGSTNGRLAAGELDRVCSLDDSAWALLEEAADTLGLSARGLHRTTRVARTIADLADRGVGIPELHHRGAGDDLVEGRDLGEGCDQLLVEAVDEVVLPRVAGEVFEG